MAMLSSVARPLALSSFHARLQAPRLIHNLRQIKVELYTPGALQAIIDAPTVAREHKQTKTRPESVMVSLLKQENGKGVKLPEEMGVNPLDMKLQLLAFLDRQPKVNHSIANLQIFLKLNVSAPWRKKVEKLSSDTSVGVL